MWRLVIKIVLSVPFRSKCSFPVGGLFPEAPAFVSCFQAATPVGLLSVLIQAFAVVVVEFDPYILELKYLSHPKHRKERNN